MTAPQAILFDAVGTLIHPDPPVGQAYAHWGRQHGSQLSPEVIGQRFRDAFARQEALDAQDPEGRTSPEREHQRWEQIVAETFDDVAPCDALFTDLWQHFAAGSSWRVDAEILPVLAHLRESGRTIGVASNFDERLHDVCRELKLPFEPQREFVSATLGHRKPHPQFFATIAAALSLPPHELLLVGDNLSNDYRAALACGWQAVLWRPATPQAGVLSAGTASELIRLLG